MSAHGGVPLSRLYVLVKAPFLQIEPALRVEHMQVHDGMEQEGARVALRAGGLADDRACFVNDGEVFHIILPALHIILSELEVDEGLQVGRYKLVNHENDEHGEQGDDGHRQHGKVDAVPTLEAVGQPVDNHAHHDEEEHVAVFPEYLRDDGSVPLAAYARHHVLGRVPGHLVGHGGVKVGAGAEEQPRERDETERLHDGPRPPEVRERIGASRQVIEVTHQRAGGYDEHPDEEQVEHRHGHIADERPKAACGEHDGHHACRPTHVAPELVHNHAHAVQAAPNHEVPARPVPKAAEQHGYEGVQVGDYLDTPRRPEPGHEADEQGHAGHRQRGIEASRQDEGYKCDEHYPEIGAEAGATVAAERDVQVVLQPLAERYVPAFPEIGRVGRLVGRVEVFGKIEAHEHGHAYGDVGVARKIGIHLQRIAEKRHEVLETREEQRVLEHAVYEVHSNVIAQDNLFGQPVQHPEHGQAKLPPRQTERAVELGDELACADYRPGHQLRKEAHVETEVKDIVHRPHLPPVNIHGVADDLESIERNAHGQHDAVHAETPRIARKGIARPGEHVEHMHVPSEQAVQHVREKVGILEVAKQQQVERDRQAKEQLAPPLLPRTINGPRQEEVGTGHEHQQQHEQAARLVVEKQAYEEQERVAQHPPAVQQAEQSVHDGEERPEVELGEQQGRILIERENGFQKLQQHYANKLQGSLQATGGNKRGHRLAALRTRCKNKDFSPIRNTPRAHSRRKK